MNTVTLSPKYQVVIPRLIRNRLNLKPGLKLQVIEVNGHIELIPERDIADYRGLAKGINIDFDREDDRL